MLKSILAAAFMTTSFTIITVSAITITNDQAFAKKKRPVGDKTAAWYLTQCMLNSDSKMDQSKPRKTFVRCCSRSLGKCIVCRNDGKGSCYTTSYFKRAKILLDRPGLGTRPSGTELAPAKDKPKKRWPSPIGTFNKAPVYNAPTKDKPKKSWPSTTGTMNTVPMKQYKMAPVKQK